MVRTFAFSSALLLTMATPALASPAAAPRDTVVITATKLPSEIALTPSMVSVVTGDDLRARGARDLRTALELVGGVDIAPGGDAGPAGSVPGMWGLREFDAFLLVVDGIPYGGAFNPALTTLDLTNVARIEVLRGAAPVMYGATSFVGVIHVIHAPAGESPARATTAMGSPGTALGEFSVNLPSRWSFQHSVTVNAETREFSQDDSGVQRIHGLYRAAIPTSIGELHADVDVTALRQDPYSPHPREGNVLSARFPLDANVNPTDARQDQDRGQLTCGLSQEHARGALTSTLSIAHTRTRNTRGFLREAFAENGVTPNVDGFRQTIDTDDVYFDTYFAARPGARLQWLAGIDWLYGKGEQTSDNLEYAVFPDGHNRPDSHALPVDESTELEVNRSFAGLYSQIQWHPRERWYLIAGLRLNHTVEHRTGEGSVTEARATDRREQTRLSGVVGATAALWQQAADYFNLFVDYRDTYKPAAADFGPEAEGEILAPETAQSWEGGLRASLLEGRVAFEASYFQMDFDNLVVRENIEGLPALANAGRERFHGAEIELTYRANDHLRLVGTFAHHDATFVDYRRLRPDGSIQQLAGKRLELSPSHLAAVGVVLEPANGLVASVVASRTGSRFLNKANTSVAEAYTTLDVGLGYRAARWELRLDGYNLTDRRDPVAESELGDAQFYRLPGRSVLASITVHRSESRAP